jgi:glycosyltransferase involved in cell wall biosynthesis
MESLAQELSIQDSVVFMGHLKFGDPIFDFLDSLDLFVMPSRAEGLGRALVEAMARGCPCVGSQVGGIAELLDFGELVPPGDPVSLADKIMEVTGNPLRMKQMAQRNLEKAKQFSPELLKEVRHNFYSYVRLHSGAAK